MTGAAHASVASDLAEAAVAGNRRAAAKLISRIESGDPEVASTLRALYARGRETPIVGITGPPGAGKSTLTDQLVACWRTRGETVAVLAVDPSSPVTGGAILGDRVRMTRHNTDSGVFIRSMSARGRLGGLAGATGDALIVLDVMGFDRILVETVGAGQSEIDILHHAHTVLVVQTPAGGDAIQAMKSGLLEIADVFVVNKSDVPGADRIVSQLRETVEQSGAEAHGLWSPPVLKAQAATGVGISELDAALRAHVEYLDTHPDQKTLRRRASARALLLGRAIELLQTRYREGAHDTGAFEQQVDDILQRRSDPRTAALNLLKGGLK